MLEEIDCPRGEIDSPEGEVDVLEGEIDSLERLFLDTLGVGCKDEQSPVEIMCENSARLTKEHFDRGDRYAFYT